jgi:uncharacterized protein YjiS (DUF1127 family)
MIRIALDRRNASGSNFHADRHTASPNLFAVMASNTLSMVRTMARTWRERARSQAELAAPSDRELQDIGTCRSSISEEISKPFWRA